MIECPICRKEYKQLTAQHIFTHNITIDQFRLTYPNVDLGNNGTRATQRDQKIKRVLEKNVRCLQCGSLIDTANGNRLKFCNHTCSAIYNNAKREAKHKKSCLYCGEDFVSKAKHAKFCSRECSGLHHRSELIEGKCDFCKKDIKFKKTKLYKSNYHFCNNTCKKGFFKSQSHLRGTFSGHNKMSAQSKYRKMTFEEYENKCYYCGYDTCINILQVHHLDEDRTNNKIENLRIVCPTCHAEVHYGIK